MSNIKEIRKKARGYGEETARVLSDMVKVPSFSGEEENVIRHLEKTCRAYGLDDVYVDGMGSLIVRVGTGAKKLVFDAHIDTVGTGDPSQWEKDPFSGEISDGRVYGRGTSDQKGGAAAMITAARILKEQNYRGPYSVYFAFTVLEEDCDGMCWKYLIEEEDFMPDFIVSTEPTSCRLYRGHRGRMEMELTLKGVSAHGSAPERGDSAAYKAARAALALEQLNESLQPDEDNFLGKGTIVVSQIDVKGPSQCAVPDQARLYLDRRLTWGEDADLAINQVKNAVGKALKADPAGVDVTMPRFTKRGWKNLDYSQELYFPTWKMDEAAPLVQAGARAYESLFGGPPEIDKWTFSTNLVATTGRHKVPAIGFGPGDENQAHAPNEMNRIEDLETCTAFYAALPYIMEEEEL